jgi:LmbE family N-acetylglucosaminyl deacetylase
MSKLLVVAAHPDDECLGAGGILHQWKGKKHIHIVSSQWMGTERPKIFAKKVNATVYSNPFMPDNRLDTVPLIEIVKEIEGFKYKPDIILTHYEHDLNIDHRITYQAVMTAFRGEKVDIYSFEVPCSTGWALKPFEPNVFVDIDREKKIELLKIYDSEMRKPPHPRSYENIKSVERFKLIRKYGL